MVVFHFTMEQTADAIAVDNVTKDYGATRALAGVSVRFKSGEVHGVIGENGAGKSTLMKILGGVERPNAGRVIVRGAPVALQGVPMAQRLGISMVHQELNLVDELTVAENIFLGRESTRFGFINQSAMRRISREILGRLRCPLEPARKVKCLSVAQKQMVEIAKALSGEASVLILDEPTAVLSRQETGALFDVIGQLRAQGVAIIYISHILPEVLNICDRATVLRDGQMVTEISPEQMPRTTERELASLMVGRPMSQHFPPREWSIGEKLLQVENFGVEDRVRGASFFVRRGEILGFAGLIGAGRTELAEGIMGLRGKTTGTIRLEGKPLKIRYPGDAVEAGIAYVPEDRKDSGLMLDMDVTSNTTMVSLERYTMLLTRRGAEDRAAQNYVRSMRIKIGSLRQPVRALSGGNQQKVALAKWLEIHPKLLIVDEPTRGVDVGAKEEIYRLIRSLTAQGMACMLISSELNEVLGLSDRIAVMQNGRIVATLEGARATEEIVMQHAAGVGGVA
jgi:ribose transport system ATP-binding protein